MCGHSESRDAALDACWRCLAAERDPPLAGPSPWWHRQLCCHCPQPLALARKHWCGRCRRPLRRVPTLVTFTGKAA